ncbi:MAG: tRNA (adenosine(37)-N6)-threonylcarbamoyltransferase complex ATPase subunit type 1 TsaE [Candidatus Moranbacteria bacterium]|jgi:tRNA threonylcarbamoyladenosine biosynthesis protein TsaE|nr:tRNA (adenosine(37)-N6)-threonylcarbamoyltransferase complex ATPase subunit type 1 TsaE [Candidatus Moranbacteria bacterium]
MDIISHSEEETKIIARDFAKKIPAASVVALRGDLGAGKTSFSAGVLAALGAVGPFQSPTFVIMHRYDLPRPSAQGIRRVYHIDAYRINDPEDLARLGFEEWISDPEGLVLVEWPEHVETLLPESATSVSFETASETERRISWESLSVGGLMRGAGE